MHSQSAALPDIRTLPKWLRGAIAAVVVAKRI